MAANGPQPGVGGEKPFEISLEDIDTILDQEDPTFNKQLEVISADPDLKGADLESLTVNEDDLVTEDQKQEKAKELSERFPIVFVILKPLRLIKDYFKRRLIALRNQILLLISRTIAFFRNDFIDLVKYWISLLLAVLRKVAKAIGIVLALPTKTKFVILAMVGLAGGAGFLLLSSLKGNYFFNWDDGMLREFSQVADHTYKFSNNEPWEKLYSAFPQPEHSVILQKIVVNLVRVNPNENPMLAFKVFLVADSQSTAIEIKDREKEILDHLARAAEGFTYAELITIEGKDRLKNGLKEEANKILNQGEVSQVNIDTFILKP